MSGPLIVGIGGSTRPGSSTERAVAYALGHCEALGARTLLVGAELLAQLPIYATDGERSPAEAEFIAAIRAADGVIVGTPGYHGSLSGLIKNALDLIEETAKDPRPYLTGRAVGCIVTAYGWQATGTTLVALRSIVHALRGWPTPMGAGLNMIEGGFDPDGAPTGAGAASQLRMVAEQVMQFAGAFSSTGD
jgi:FMN reductase